MSKEQIQTIAEITLRTLLAGSVAITAVALPGLVSALKPLVAKKARQANQREIYRSLFRLRKRKMIYFDQIEQRWKLTKKGYHRASMYELRDLSIERQSPNQWDGKWRIIIFDIPESLKQLRTLYRTKLMNLGFTYLQRSAWVYPFPCQKIHDELAKRLDLSSELVFIESDMVIPEDKLLKRYNLQR